MQWVEENTQRYQRAFAAGLNIALAYRRDGTVVSQSSTGRATHDELGARLSFLLSPFLGTDTSGNST
jgi:hypothetical protein